MSLSTPNSPPIANPNDEPIQVRCTGERPSCCRCIRLRRSCTWTNSSAKRPNRDNDSSTFSRANIRNENCIAFTECESTHLGIPPALLDKLVDLYFSKVYNAALLLHRPSFAQSLASGIASKHVVLSVCALASWYGKSSWKATCSAKTILVSVRMEVRIMLISTKVSHMSGLKKPAAWSSPRLRPREKKT